MIIRGYFGDVTPKIKYNLDDHLGSSNVSVDDTGALVSFEEYYPFGETSFGSYGKKRYRFCGKEKDEESGLYYYGARYYSPWTCRFVSVDPLAGKYAQLSPYNYASNNPITHIDVDGMQNPAQEPSQQGGGKSNSTEQKQATWATDVNQVKLPEQKAETKELKSKIDNLAGKELAKTNTPKTDNPTVDSTKKQIDTKKTINEKGITPKESGVLKNINKVMKDSENSTSMEHKGPFEKIIGSAFATSSLNGVNTTVSAQISQTEGPVETQIKSEQTIKTDLSKKIDNQPSYDVGLYLQGNLSRNQSDSTAYAKLKIGIFTAQIKSDLRSGETQNIRVGISKPGLSLTSGMEIIIRK